jgi:hypothetical protein
MVASLVLGFLIARNVPSRSLTDQPPVVMEICFLPFGAGGDLLFNRGNRPRQNTSGAWLGRFLLAPPGRLELRAGGLGASWLSPYVGLNWPRLRGCGGSLVVLAASRRIPWRPRRLSCSSASGVIRGVNRGWQRGRR